MASEAEASCESDPNFAIICAFLEKFGELCGIGSLDFVELQSMLENNQEVSPELMNLHIKLLRKTKKNVTVERWERALVNMCHTYSSKDAWEIERFGYKKTRLQVKLRALKELLEMQFDYNTKFKNEVNKMTAESLRPQPLGRDKLGRAYWFQTDNNYQIRIYKEDPDEETWHLVAKDRDGLLSLMNELADGDSKLSSDSALNEDSNSLSEKPFIDTGQSEDATEKIIEQSASDSTSNPEQVISENQKETENKEIDEKKSSESKEEESQDIEKKMDVESSDDDEEETDEKQDPATGSEEVKRPMLRIKSLSELMEKPEETRKTNFIPDLPELTIIKKAKLDSSQITITKKSRDQPNPKEIEVSPAIESPSGQDNDSCDEIVSEEIEEPVMVVSGDGSGEDCQAGNEKPMEEETSVVEKSEEIGKNQEEIVVSEEIEEEVMFIFGEGSGRDCEAGNETTPKPEKTNIKNDSSKEEEIIVSEEIEEEVMFIVGEGSGEDCLTGNEKEQTTTQETEKSKNADSPNKVPIDRVNVDTIKDSKTETETHTDENPREENASPKKTQFFFGPGSLNIKPCPVSPVINANVSEETTEEISGRNGSIPEENSENNKEKSEDEEVNNEVKDTIETVPEENPVTEDKVPLSECSKPQDPEEETKDNPPDDPGKEEIEEEDTVQEPEKDVNPEEAKKGNEDTETPNVQKEEEKCEDKTQTIESPETEESSSKKENSEENEESRIEEIEASKINVEAESNTGEKVQEDNKAEIEEEKSQSSGDNATKDEEVVKKDEETSEEKDENKISEPVSEDVEKTESEDLHDAKNEEIEETSDKQEDKENTTTKKEDNAEKIEDAEKPEENEDETEERDEAGVESNNEEEAKEESDKVEEEVDDVEKPEVESDEKEENSKNQAASSKRKRATRNTAVLNESITEEDMNPRKKVPVEKTKKKGPKQKNEEEESVESSSKVEMDEPRTTRQTRQTRSLVVPKAQTPVAAKAKGKAKKTASSSSKSDEAESPAPLESVTIVDTDNSSTAVENPEKDPLAVSEEEVAPTVPSITSFSFDYNPNSPAPEESKRSMRKRGRDNLEDKPEVPEKDVKRPKMRGKRTMDQSLRKSVEEKRQLVGDGSSDENEPKTKAKGNKKTPVKKKAGTPSVSDSDNASQKSEVKAKRGSAKNTRILKNLGVKEEDVSSLTDSPAPVRQSRRIAQIKIKEEATRRRVDDDEVSSKKKKKKSDDKDFKVGKRKRIEEEVKPVPTPPMVEKKRKRKTKQNKISIGWKSSSEDSDNSCQEEEEVSEYEEHHEEEPLQFKSDHEFSPESDLECDEPLPLKRARTVRKEESNDDDEEPEEEFPCQKCGKSDHPEWILLCDKCDNGWHCSCLRPALFVIPEGDWYCPTCQHETLMENLNKKLIEFDKMMVKKEMEDRRKERLAYVGISLNNVLPAKEKKEKKTDKSYDSEESSKENTPSASESEESDSDEPIYQLRQRRQAHSYKFQDYDDLINSALQEEPAPEVEKTHTLGRGKDIATIVNAAKEEEEKNGFEDLPPVVPRDPDESRKKAISYRKKPKRLNNLEVNSDDEVDDSDEDFKGSSSEESDEEEYTEDSDDSFVGKRGSRPVRRSTRARTTRYDADFINDDSDEAPSKKKKKKRYFSDSESSLSDDWRGKKKKSSKKSKKKKMFDDSDLENYRKKKPKIKYGMDSEDDTRGRRTRGKKTSYLDTLGSDSEDETLKKKIKDKSDDEYVAEDDEEKESEEEKPSGDEDDDDEHPVKPKKHKSEESDSEDETLVVKKVKLKTKRTIMDSEEEEEDEDEEKEKDVKKKVVESPKALDKNQVINEELAKTVREFEEQVPKDLKTEPKLPVVQPGETQKPSVVPGLNVEKLKACGITVTKVAKDMAGIPPGVESKETPNKLIEIGAKPMIPVNLTKSLDELDEDEVEEMMENEEYANRQLELAAIQIREAKRMKELEKKEPPLTITRKPTEMIPKKQGTGRFFNMKPSPEPMLGNPSMLMNDDDNDELSEPPGVTLPMFSELGAMKVHNLSKSNTRSPLNNTPPPPPSPNRAVPVPLHNMGLPHPSTGMVPPNPFGSPRGMMHHMRLTRPMGPRGSNMPPMMGPRVPMPPMDPINPPMRLNVPGNIPNVPRNMNVPPPMTNNIPMGTSPPLPISSSNVPTGPGLPPMGVVASVAPTAVPTGLNMTMGANAASPNVTPGPGANVATFNESPDGTPKKRRGRGKGKKTLAAEAAAAAAAAAGLPESNKIGNNGKPPAANIEIASPPQPFSQSQPAPSVITRMLQTTAGKGAFPVGRIRPKQFAMMQDSDDSQSPRPADTQQEKDMPTHPAPTSHPPVSAPHGGHPPGHYGPPTGQYPPNYYPKDDQAQPPHGYHHQRPPPPPMHPYPPHPTQPPMDAPPPIHQPPISIADSPSLAQYSAPPPPPSKQPYEGLPPHRPPYQNAGAGYNYEYNVPPPVMSEEGVVPPAAYENPAVYPDQYETGSSGVDPSGKIVEEEPSGEFGGLVSYFSSQHEDDLEQ